MYYPYKQINGNFTAGCFVPQHFKPAIKSHYLGVRCLIVVENFKSMPPILKLITVHGVFCFLFFLSAVIPGFDVNFTYKGQPMGFDEIWQNDLGVHLILIGLFFPISAVLLLKKWQYCRQFYSFVILTTFIVQNANSGSFMYLPFALIVPSLLIVYLFKYDKVKVYFGT
ncbi:hypothetical protein ACPUVO_12445 [Pseudocolwellia sp. HL-MZ19]|uniref:hypothetical protein n=1 Tax=Pseudocolwellia sp. HL-MZ19 TaxID=3400846 RepID=UPI003CF39D97